MGDKVTGPSLNERLSRTAELAVRARLQFDLFRQLLSIHPDEREAMPAWEYFRFAREAHEWAFYVRIANLACVSEGTDSLPRLMSALVAEEPSLGTFVTACREQLKAHEETVQIVKRIRNKVVAHQDAKLRPPEVYRQLNPATGERDGISPDALSALSDAVIQIVGALCQVRGLPRPEAYASPAQALRAALSKLDRHGAKRPVDEM